MSGTTAAKPPDPPTETLVDLRTAAWLDRVDEAVLHEHIAAGRLRKVRYRNEDFVVLEELDRLVAQDQGGATP
jgi:hypothetical protein